MRLRLKPHTIVTLIVMLAMNTGFSQEPPDSLLKNLNTTTNDSVRVRTMLDIGENIESRSTEKSLMYYRQALELAQKIQNKRLILSSLTNLGIGHMESNHLDSAVSYFNLAMQVAVGLRDTNRIAVIYSNLGNAYRYKKDRVQSLENFQRAIDLLEEKKDSLRLPAVYQNVSIFLSENNDYRESIVYSNKAYLMASAQGDDYTACNALISMSDAWSDLGNPDKQFDLLQKAIVLAKKTGDLEESATIYNNLGAFFVIKKIIRKPCSNIRFPTKLPHRWPTTFISVRPAPEWQKFIKRPANRTVR